MFPSFVAGGVKFIFKHSLIGSGLGDLTAGSCAADVKNAMPFKLAYTSHPVVDHVLCKLSALFHFTLGSEVGYGYFTYIVATASVILLMMGVEASRAKRSALVGYPAVWLLLSQLISVGLAVPLSWLVFFTFNHPTSIHSNVRATKAVEKSSPLPAKTYKVSQVHAETIMFGLIVGSAAPTYAMRYFKEDPYFSAISQIYPVLMAVA